MKKEGVYIIPYSLIPPPIFVALVFYPKTAYVVRDILGVKCAYTVHNIFF